ncbi:MAG: hypothetical protein K8T89_22420 [Planctomycetes bacterium]|nr:hypothetical protein [Planctomycetota bacterium]
MQEDMTKSKYEVGPILKEIGINDLRDYCHEIHGPLVDAILKRDWKPAPPKTTSGLVELQKLLHRKKT